MCRQQLLITIYDFEYFIGTGKTYIAAAIAEQFYLENSYQRPMSNVLLCSPTHQALNDAEGLYLQYNFNFCHFKIIPTSQIRLYNNLAS